MKFDTLDEWLSWQESLHTQSIDMGLDRIRPVFDRLIDKPLATKSIVVGGTNGKGSTSAFLESIYVAAGYRVGVYSSPHLFKYNERVRVNGEQVSDVQLCEAFEKVDKIRGETSLTYFEFGTLAAFNIFQKTKLDVVILEVGLGGRLDAVNLVDADIAIVTNVDLDHESWLGDTREKIAYEKFGIARQNTPVIFADDEPPANVTELCESHQCQLLSIGKDFGFTQQQDSWQWWSENKKLFSLPFPSLHGFHQLKNASTALLAVHLLADALPVSMAHIRVGLSKAVLPGRFDVVQEANNLIIFDVAHNPHGIRAFVKQLNQIPKLGNNYLVLGMLEDKNLEAVIGELESQVDYWYLGGLSIPRGLSVSDLQTRVSSVVQDKNNVSAFENVEKAFVTAYQQLKTNDKLLVLGSFYTVAEAQKSLKTKANEIKAHPV